MPAYSIGDSVHRIGGGTPAGMIHRVNSAAEFSTVLAPPCGIFETRDGTSFEVEGVLKANPCTQNLHANVDLSPTPTTTTQILLSTTS